ncbi:MAG: hypothetical protein AAGJ46_00380 [Planctomycetota bacterium]
MSEAETPDDQRITLSLIFSRLTIACVGLGVVILLLGRDSTVRLGFMIGGVFFVGCLWVCFSLCGNEVVKRLHLASQRRRSASEDSSSSPGAGSDD